MLPVWFDLYDSMTPEKRAKIRNAWSDSCCMGRLDPTTHPVAEMFENITQVSCDNMHAQGRLNVDICENHPDFVEFIRRRRDVFWEPLPLGPLRSSNDLVDKEYCRVFDHIKKKGLGTGGRRKPSDQQVNIEIATNKYWRRFIPARLRTKDEVISGIKALKVWCVQKSEAALAKGAEDVDKRDVPTLLRKIYYPVTTQVQQTGMQVDGTKATITVDKIEYKVGFQTTAFDRLLVHAERGCLTPEMSLLDMNRPQGVRSTITGLQRYARPHGSSGAESNHSVYGELSNNLSHIGLEKQDRRLLLRIIWLNHDKHRKAAGDDVEKDDWPMPFLFEQQHHRWQSYFTERPFDRVPDLSGLNQCVPCVGFDYYTKTTPAAIAKAEKRLEDMRTARAQGRIRDRASEHMPEQAAAAAARVQSSIIRFATDSSSMVEAGSGSALAAQMGADAPWKVPGARVAKKRRNNHQQRPGSSMFVNFALNRDARLRGALKTAMREVAEVDYKAIAQHFNNQFANEDPPIMTSAGYVQAYMDREERSMSIPVATASSMSASMSTGRSRSTAGGDRFTGMKRRRKGQNIVIDRVEDIQDLTRRDLNALIEYIQNTYRVHIRRHKDLGTRRADVVAAWQGTWALPLVLPPAPY